VNSCKNIQWSKNTIYKTNIAYQKISRLIVELSIPMPVLEYKYSRSTANQPYGFIAGAIYIYIYIYIYNIYIYILYIGLSGRHLRVTTSIYHMPYAIANVNTRARKERTRGSLFACTLNRQRNFIPVTPKNTT